MITTILLAMIGIKLNILNGWYLGLLIAKAITELIILMAKIYKIGKEA